MGAGSSLPACQRGAYGPAASCDLPPPAPLHPWVLPPPALLPASPGAQHPAGGLAAPSGARLCPFVDPHPKKGLGNPAGPTAPTQPPASLRGRPQDSEEGSHRGAGVRAGEAALLQQGAVGCGMGTGVGHRGWRGQTDGFGDRLTTPAGHGRGTGTGAGGGCVGHSGMWPSSVSGDRTRGAGHRTEPRKLRSKRDRSGTREGSGALGLLRGEAVGAPLEGLKYGGLRDMVVPGGPSKRWGSLPTPGFV